MAGTRRVGAVIARRLAEEGAELVIMYNRSRADAEELARDIEDSGGQVHLFRGDIALEKDVRGAVDYAIGQLADFSFVVNLASDYPRTPLASLDATAWDREMAWARGGYLMAVESARHMMRKQGPTRGHIILFGDWAAGETPYIDYLPYLTAKAATEYLVRALGLELAPHGVLVNAIAPGPTARPPYVPVDEWEREVLARAPLHRESSAEEIAELTALLLKSETITGETIRVDSGRHLAGAGIEAARAEEVRYGGLPPGDQGH